MNPGMEQAIKNKLMGVNSLAPPPPKLGLSKPPTLTKLTNPKSSPGTFGRGSPIYPNGTNAAHTGPGVPGQFGRPKKNPALPVGQSLLLRQFLKGK